MRLMREIYKHRGDTCDAALSFVLRAVAKYTGLNPDLQDADPIVHGFRILETIDDS